MQKFQLDIEEYRIKIKQYRREVQKITRKQPIYQLEHSEKRGRNNHHLDHILSVNFGFNSGLDPEIIGNIRNLRFIPCKNNLEKKDYLDKTSWDVFFMMIDEGMI